MGKTLLGFLIVALVFGGIFYYSVQKQGRAYYETRKTESYNGLVEKKEIFKKGSYNEGYTIFLADQDSRTTDRNLYKYLVVGDSINKAANNPTVEVYRGGKHTSFTFLEPVFLKKENFLIEEKSRR